MDDDYAFMVVDAFGTTYKIWADGRTEGFGPCATVTNKIPRIIDVAIDDALNAVEPGLTYADIQAMCGVSAEMLGVKDDEVDHHGCL